MDKLLCLFVIGALFHTGKALTCYDCDSRTTYCNDNDRIMSVQCSFPPSNHESACFKRVLENQYGHYNITRQCVHIPEYGREDFRQIHCQTHHRNVHVRDCDICYTDYCNGPTGGVEMARVISDHTPVTCYSCRDDIDKYCYDPEERYQKSCPAQKCGKQILRDKYTKHQIIIRSCITHGREYEPQNNNYELIYWSTCDDYLCNSAPTFTAAWPTVLKNTIIPLFIIIYVIH